MTAPSLPPTASSSTEPRLSPREAGLSALFLLSGVAALAYQLCWQRMLSFSFGTDIESITITVSSFMLGLGLGALLGGGIADRRPGAIVMVFAAFELGIGLFGLASTALVPAVGESFSLHSRAAGAAAVFLLMLLPTMLMGATLPMLIAHFYRIQGNVGVSTGLLYFVNTLGAGVGATLVGFVAFDFMTLKQVVVLAACVNFAVAAGGLALMRAAR